MLTSIFLWCSVIYTIDGFDILDCFDTKTQCTEEIPEFECARCYTTNTSTVCPAFGTMTFEASANSSLD